MPHYAIKDNKGNLLEIAVATSPTIAKAGAASAMLTVSLASPDELIQYGKDGRAIATYMPKKRVDATKVTDPAQRDIEEKIREQAEQDQREADPEPEPEPEQG
jgi:hypothetical protein